jgi:hypothetical protein
VHDLLEKALIVHVSAVLVEAHVASHHAFARHELEKAVAHEAHVMSRRALARHELEKAVAHDTHATSHHALARCELEKAVACGGSDSRKNVASQACRRHEPVNIPPRPQQLSPNAHQSKSRNNQSIQCPFCARG